MPRATFILATAAGLAISSNARASDITWMNTSGGPFATAANWNPAQVPGAADRAVFSRGSNYTVHLNGIGHTNSQILVSNDTVAFNLDGATYSLTSAASLSVGGGSLNNHGIIVPFVGKFYIETTTPTIGVFNAVNTYIGGNSATSLLGSGTINVYSGVTWHNTGIVLVGGGAQGTLNILGSGDVTSATGLIGQTAGGTATVDGGGSSWTMSSTLDVGGNANGTLNITNGGLAHDVTGRVALAAGVTGAVTVSGTGNGVNSTWASTGALTLGSVGAGNLTVSAGGHVASIGGTVASSAGSHGNVSISGSGSHWFNTGALSIGASGAAAVTIGAGGVLDSSGVTSVAAAAAGSATVDVSGTGSEWNSGSFNIGGNASAAGGPATVTIGAGSLMNAGAGTLNIWGPGTVNLNGGTIGLGNLSLGGGALNWNSGTLYFQSPLLVMPGGALGPTPSIATGRTLHAGQGIVIDAATNPTMSVPGGVVNSDSTLSVGDATHGTLNLSAGAVLNTPDFIVGGAQGATGLVHVDGAGSLWHQGVPSNFEDVIFGDAGTGTLQVTGGAEFVVENNPVDLGNQADGHGTVLVSGQNSLLQLQSYFISVGRAGPGSVDVQSGGQVVADAVLSELGGSGSINISGPGSAWQAHMLTVGHAGSGSLTINSGGALSAGDIFFADGQGSSATATIDGVGSSLTAAAGSGSYGQFVVGGAATASLTIQNGAHAASYETIVGDGQPAVGTLTVRGAGSILTSSNELDAGFSGNGTILVQSGATASTLTCNIGRFPGSTGLLTVDGPGSAVTIGSQLYVGGGVSARVNITNSGAVHAAGPATVNPTGTVALTSGSLSALYLALSGGALEGSGTVTGDVNNSGSVSPGNSAGQLNIQGAYAQTAQGVLNIQIGGTTPGTQFDKLAATGAATLGGTVNITFINGYTPRSTETFAFLTASSISGSFSTVNFPALSGGGLRLIYGPGSVSLAFCYANCDGSTTAPALNVLDFSCFLNKFAAGDAYANCDGSTTPPVINVLDFNCYLNKFAAGCP